MREPKILLLDIETAPMIALLWQMWQQNVNWKNGGLAEDGYTMCWAAKWLGQKKTTFRSVHHHGVEKMLQDMWDLLDEADIVIHYNGTKFDIPVLNKEFVQAGMMPPSNFVEIDLIKTVRKRFRFHSNSLDFVCQRIGLGQKHSHKGMMLWRECMAGNAKSWKTMKKYNIVDVEILEALYMHIRPWIDNHPNMGLFATDDRPHCPNCGGTHIRKKGTEMTKTGTYQRYRCMECLYPIRGRTILKDSVRPKLK